MSRYDPIRWYLAKMPVDKREVRLSFRDVERIVGSLPASARNHRPWWGNSATSPQAVAWQGAGFVVDQVNLTAEHVTFTRGHAQRRSSGVVTAGTPAVDTHAERSTPPTEDDHREAMVQARLVAGLTHEGWQIQSVADTASRAPGIDVLATKAARILAVEVKGYPSRAYADPQRSHEVKPTSPGVQARHWYAAALLKAMLTGEEHPDYEIAIALPDVPTYRSLQRRTSGGLTTLGITTLFISTDGKITSVPD